MSILECSKTNGGNIECKICNKNNKNNKSLGDHKCRYHSNIPLRLFANQQSVLLIHDMIAMEIMMMAKIQRNLLIVHLENVRDQQMEIIVT